MLAHYLANSDFGKNRAVSMCGFSLGGLVTYNTMKTLKRIADILKPAASSILHDVTTWAAAYIVNQSGDYNEWKEKAQDYTVCNGIWHSCWSKNDKSMVGMKTAMYPGKIPVGYAPIFEKDTDTAIEEEDYDTCKIPINIDCTQVCKEGDGHYCYSTSFATFHYWMKDFY